MTEPVPNPNDPEAQFNAEYGRWERNGYFWDMYQTEWRKIPSGQQKRKWSGKKKAALAGGAVLALLIVIAGVSGGSETEPTTAAASEAAHEASPEQSAEEKAAAEEAEKQRVADRDAARQEANRIALERQQAAAAAQAARMDRTQYEVLGERDYALVAKNPDAHIGRKLVVYGYVAQFDSGTGSNQFRAYTGNAPSSRTYDFDINTIVTSTDSKILTNLVKDDFVTMYVEVKGSYNYSTTMGGSTTVPKYDLVMVDVTG